VTKLQENLQLTWLWKCVNDFKFGISFSLSEVFQNDQKLSI